MSGFSGGYSPNGEYKENLEEYMDSWNEFIKPLQDKGFIILGFDPSVTVKDESNSFSSSVSLPVWAIKKFLS